MRNLPKKKKIFTIFAGAGLATFLFGIWRSFGLLKANFSSVVAFCLKKTDIMIGFLSRLENILLVVLGGLLAVGLARGVVYFVHQLFINNKLKREFQYKLADTSPNSIAGIDFFVVEDERQFALTVGFLYPDIYVSSELARQLETQEFEAVIRHEYYHKINFHPFIKLLVSTFRTALFFLPVVRVVDEQLVLRQEALADSDAIEKTSRESLISAFLKISQGLKYQDKTPITVAQFSLSKDRLLLVVERANIPRIKIPIVVGVVSLLVVSFFMIPLASPITLRVHAQDPNSDISYVDVCYSINQSVFSMISNNQTKLNLRSEM